MLNRRIRLRVTSVFFFLYFLKKLKNKSLMPHIPQPPSLKSKSRILWVAAEPRFGIKDLIGGIWFYSEISASLIRSDTQKISYSGNILEKWYDWICHTDCTRDILKIKPGIFIFLLCVHVGIHCAENPHYDTHDCCVCSIHGSSSSEALTAIKGGQEASLETPIHWCYSSQLVFSFRKLSPSWNLCSVF